MQKLLSSVYLGICIVYTMHLAIDIDDTLCYTTERRMNIFQQRFGNPENLTPKQMTEKYEIVQRVPYRQTPQAQELVEELITQDENWTDLACIPGGREALEILSTHIPLIYVTGRQEEHRQKTLNWLQKNNFPELTLIMRPNATSEAIDAHGQFTRKARYLSLNYPDIIGIIDNSLSLAEQLDHMKYPGTHILFGHIPEKESTAPLRLQYWNTIEQLIPQIKQRLTHL